MSVVASLIASQFCLFHRTIRLTFLLLRQEFVLFEVALTKKSTFFFFSVCIWKNRLIKQSSNDRSSFPFPYLFLAPVPVRIVWKTIEKTVKTQRSAFPLLIFHFIIPSEKYWFPSQRSTKLCFSPHIFMFRFNSNEYTCQNEWEFKEIEKKYTLYTLLLNHHIFLVSTCPHRQPSMIWCVVIISVTCFALRGVLPECVL